MYEHGGHADKLGNQCESTWVVRQLLRVLADRLGAVTFEPCGEFESGIDLVVEDNAGQIGGQQCKAYSPSGTKWSVADSAKVLQRAWSQLQAGNCQSFQFVTCSPVEFQPLLISARDSSGDSEHFFKQHLPGIGADRTTWAKQIAEKLNVDLDAPKGRAALYDFLTRIQVKNFFADTASQDTDAHLLADALLEGDSKATVSQLKDVAIVNMRKRLDGTVLLQCLQDAGLTLRRVVGDGREYTQINERNDSFISGLRENLVSGRVIHRPEADQISEAINQDKGIVVLHGEPGSGKSGVLLEVVSHLDNSDTRYLAARLDQTDCGTTPREFGNKLDLPDDPVTCLAASAGPNPSVLILDQVDALRWTSAHSERFLAVCKEVARLVQSQRLLGRRMTLILACRTFDLENDPGISSWLGKASASRKDAQAIPVGELTSESIEAAVDLLGQQRGIQASELRPRTLSLLSNIQNLKLWGDAVTLGSTSVDFDSVTQLQRKCWQLRRSQVEKAGIPAQEIHDAISSVVVHMEEHGTLKAPLRVLPQNQKLRTEVFSTGCLVNNGLEVRFSHQSDLEFLIADEALGRMLSDGKDFLAWLGERSEQSLFRRESFRQLIFLTAEQMPDQLVPYVSNVLSSDSVRYHMRHVVVEALNQMEPAEVTDRCAHSLMANEKWQSEVLRYAFWRNPARIRSLIEQGTINQWISSEDETPTSRAFWLLESVVNSIPDQVAAALVDVPDSMLKRHLTALFQQADLVEISESLFRLFEHAIGNGLAVVHIPWKKISANAPERAVRLLAAVIHQLAVEGRSNSTGRTRLLNEPNSLAALERRIKQAPRRSLKLLLPPLKQLISARRQDQREDSKLKFDWSNAFERSLPRSISDDLMRLCRSGIRSLARKFPSSFLKLVERESGTPSFAISWLLANGFRSLPPIHADRAIEWLLLDESRLRLGNPRWESPWTPARNILLRHSRNCSNALFQRLENLLGRYMDPREKRLASSWLRGTRNNYYTNGFGAARHVLLSALDRSRLTKKSIGEIGVLQEKFGPYTHDFWRHERPEGGFVSSPLDKSRLNELSDAAWLGIITSPRVSKTLGERRPLGRSFLRASTVRDFAHDLQVAAARQPERFARLAMWFPEDTPTEYIYAVLATAALDAPNQDVPTELRENWSKASTASVLTLLDRFASHDEPEIAKAFCRVVANRDDLQLTTSTIAAIKRHAQHVDPLEGTIYARRGAGITDCTVDDLRTNAINCVRGMAANTIAELIFNRVLDVDQFEAEIESLTKDKHPAVLFGVTRLLMAIYATQPERALQILKQISGVDSRVLASPYAFRVIVHSQEKHPDVSSELVKRMLDSDFDDVVTKGAGHCFAFYLLHGQLSSEATSLVTGSVACRLGVAQACAELVQYDSTRERSMETLIQLLFDPEENVREAVSRVLFTSEELSIEQLSPLLEAFVSSTAIQHDASPLFYCLKQYEKNLSAVPEIVLQTARSLIDRIEGSPASIPVNSYEADSLSEPVIAIYDNAWSAKNSQRANECLDILDKMLEHGICSAHETLQQLQES